MHPLVTPPPPNNAQGNSGDAEATAALLVHGGRSAGTDASSQRRKPESTAAEKRVDRQQRHCIAATAGLPKLKVGGPGTMCTYRAWACTGAASLPPSHTTAPAQQPGRGLFCRPPAVHSHNQSRGPQGDPQRVAYGTAGKEAKHTHMRARYGPVRAQHVLLKMQGGAAATLLRSICLGQGNQPPLAAAPPASHTAKAMLTGTP